jgi:hypothetical protein
MKTLYMRNVPEAVVERLQRLAADAGMTVSAVVVRELTEASRQADNPALLERLPDIGVDPAMIVRDFDIERASRWSSSTPPMLPSRRLSAARPWLRMHA